jgi:hypothetical protein
MACGRPGRPAATSGAPRPPPRRYGHGPHLGPHHCRLAPMQAHRGMGRMAAMIALPGGGSARCAAGRHVFGDEVVAGPRGRMGADPTTRLARLARDHTDHGGTIGGRGAMPLALIGALAGRIEGVAMGRAWFPPALWSNASASKAVPASTSVGAVSCRWVWRRGRRGWSCVRDSPSSRARRAVGSPWASPRRRSTRGAGRGRVLAKTVPVSRVS